MKMAQNDKLHKLMWDFEQLKNASPFMTTLSEDDDNDLVPPKAFEIFLDAEDKYFSALEKLEEKHRSLSTAAEIENFAKEILKLCK